MADQADLDRLVRLLGMTGSDSDGEALTAIRMAGKLLAELKLTWADVLTMPTARRWGPAIAEGYQPSPEAAAGAAAAPMRDESLSVATARVRLDFVLRRRRFDPMQAAHFEAIRSHHQRTGYIGPAHRAQIDRQFFKAGWDSPLAPEKGDKIGADQRKVIE